MFGFVSDLRGLRPALVVPFSRYLCEPSFVLLLHFLSDSNPVVIFESVRGGVYLWSEQILVVLFASIGDHEVFFSIEKYFVSFMEIH